MSKSLTELFNAKRQSEYVSTSALDAAKSKQLDENVARTEGGAESIGRLPLSQSKAGEADPENSKNKEKAFSKLIYKLQEQRQWLMQQMQNIQKQIDRLNEDLDEVSRDMRAIKDAMEDFENGILKLDSDGYPLNERVSDMIKDWEERHDENWNASDPDSLTILEMMLAEQEQNIQQLEDDRENLQSEFNDLNNQLQQVETTVESLLNNNEIIPEKYAQNYVDVINEIDIRITVKKQEDQAIESQEIIESKLAQISSMRIDLNSI